MKSCRHRLARTRPVTKVFDYSRSAGEMRFRDEDGNVIMADRMAGRWEFVKANRDGKLDIECDVVTNGKTAYVYPPDGSLPKYSSSDVPIENSDNHDSCRISSNAPFPQGRETMWRLCYARELATQGEEKHWRLRDERSGELWFVKGYQGPADVAYFDRGSHVFVPGPATVDEEGIAHFA